jgi:hypothetical protein
MDTERRKVKPGKREGKGKGGNTKGKSNLKGKCMQK